MKKGKIDGYVLSDIGRLRKNNEDNFILGHYINKNQNDDGYYHFREKIGNWVLAGVFDGMGGAEGGEMASLLAANTFKKNIKSIFLYDYEASIDASVEKIFRSVNDAIIEKRKEIGICGTTATILVTNGERLKIFHMGDSRAYMKKNNGLVMLTKDQTVAQLKLDIGIYHDKEEVPVKENHQLMEYLGREQSNTGINPYESEWFDISPGDVILLCSDGLYDMCSEDCIVDIIDNNNDIAICSKKLLFEALNCGGIDNITIILMKVE